MKEIIKECHIVTDVAKRIRYIYASTTLMHHDIVGYFSMDESIYDAEQFIGMDIEEAKELFNTIRKNI